MPIKIPNELPAKEILNSENIFVMDEDRAFHQDIRPLKIILLNLMPTKIQTETQLLRVMSNTPLQIEVTFLSPESYVSKNTPQEHMIEFYNTFNDIKNKKYDGLIVTGAPIETMEFEEVDYWEELTRIFEWSKTNVTSTLHICWGAQAGLYYHYGIPKYLLLEKKFGIFSHNVLKKNELILRGFDDEFYAPHSRHTEVRREDIESSGKLEILSESEEAGIYIVISNDRKQIFVTGHSEYDPYTLDGEYKRDRDKGMDTEIPKNYYVDDNPSNPPRVKWRSHANLLFSNWLNYYVYQETPYELGE